MKNNLFTKSLLVLMLSALMVTVSSNSFAQQGHKQHMMNRDSSKHEMGIPNLTADQKTKIDALRVKNQKEVTPLRNELNEKEAHLRTLESADKVDKDAINKTIDEITALQGKIMKLRVNHRLEVSALLTDDQKVYFNSHHGDGMGMGKGMGKKMKKDMKGPNCPNPNCPNKK